MLKIVVDKQAAAWYYIQALERAQSKTPETQQRVDG